LVVTVHLHTVLQRETPGGRLRRLQVSLPATSTVADLLAHLELRPDPEWTLFVVNGRQATPTQALREGDEVHLIPALSGG
jgi:sulfur carrier protein ThiS